MAEHYNVVFKGETKPGEDINDVKKRLMDALKISTKSVENLFSGGTMIIKKDVNAATAEKYKTVFESAGAICRVQPLESPEAAGPKEEEFKFETQPGGKDNAESAHSNRKRKLAPTHRCVGEGDMIITNIETVPGKTVVEHFGLVSGSTIRAKHVGKDIMASLKNLVGGELKGYTQLLQESRDQAIKRMTEQARQLGANAIVNVRFSTSSVAQGAAELYAYGTAVRVE